MTPKLTYYGNVTDGALKIIRRKEFDHAVRQFEGKQIEITIQVKRRKRSIFQNNYYWGVIVPMVQVGLNDAGYKLGKEQTHDFIKSQFAIKEIVNEQTGEILKLIGSTAEMTTTEMNEYFSEVVQWAAEYLNVQIPEPGEQIEIELT